jgi:p-hydroxybenzoate 3-monooxygenase
LRTQVAIIGAGPAGLMLAQLLHLEGIASIVLERQSRAYVEARLRAGVLEPGTVALLRRAGVAERLNREALEHGGFSLAVGDEMLRIDLKALTGAGVTVYGQTEIVQDLVAARLGQDSALLFEARDVAIRDFLSGPPGVRYTRDGETRDIVCDFIAGCDGFHGVSRASVPAEALTLYERSLPAGWLGVLADTPPLADELVYARGRRGFALCSMRSRTRSRHYVQCPPADRVEDWPDARFWDELRRRLPARAAETLVTGPSLEKSIAPLRSFVAEPMRFGALFLLGDAAHIVPPTGAKGLNLAMADAATLAAALGAHYRDADDRELAAYSETCLGRVWRALRFSWEFTRLMHRLDEAPFAERLQTAAFRELASSRAAAKAFALNYVGM